MLNPITNPTFTVNQHFVVHHFFRCHSEIWILKNPITTPSLNPIRFPLDSPLHPMINGSIPFQIPIPNPHEIPMKSDIPEQKPPSVSGGLALSGAAGAAHPAAARHHEALGPGDSGATATATA